MEGNLVNLAGFTYTLSCMKVPDGNRPGKKTTVSAGLPLYCDYQCPHASFAPADATGACRRELGVFCNLLGRFNTKNSPCKAREERPERHRRRR